MDECRNIALDIAKGRITRTEVNALFDTLAAEKKRLEAGDALQSVESGMMEKGRIIAEDAALAGMIEKRNRLQNIVTESKLRNMIKLADDKVGQPGLGLHAALTGINTPIEGAQRSVNALRHGIMTQYAGGLVSDLKAAKLLTQFNKMSGDFERSVARELADLNMTKPTGKAGGTAEAKSIAKIMQKYQKAAVERENRAGAFIRSKEGYVTRQSHNADKIMRAGQDVWKEMVGSRLNYEAMEIAPEDTDKFLTATYEAITTGVRKDKPVPDVSEGFTGPGNQAKKASASRVLEFKSPDDWLDYDKAFGRGSLRETYMAELSRAASNTALMTNFGTNPQAMLERVLKIAKNEYRADPKKLHSFDGGWDSYQNSMDVLSGAASAVQPGAAATWARAGMIFRSVESMAKLGGSVLSQFSDIANIAASRHYQGRSMVQGWNDAFTAGMKGLSPGDQRIWADRVAVGIEGHLGDFMGQFHSGDELTGTMSKLMGLFFKVNLMAGWTNSNKRGVGMMIARDLGDMAGKGFDGQTVAGKRLLGIYGIDAATWEKARKGVQTGPDGRTYLMHDQIEDDAARESILALITNEVDYAVPTPGARERAILTRGYPPGTVGGEFMRFVTQFKSFAVVGLTKGVGRQVYGYGAKSLWDAMARGQGSNLGLINLIAGATVMGYFSLQAKELAAGKNPRPLSAATVLAAMAQGGGLGVYGDFLFGQSSRFGADPIITALGPAAGVLSDVAKLYLKGMGFITEPGESSDFEHRLRSMGTDALRLAKSNMPFANLLYTRAALDYLVVYQLQEQLNPGYLKRVERRVKKDNNQTYWLQPSSIVKTGGGFR